MKYTVIGFWKDTGQRFAETVEAENAFLAEQLIGTHNPGITTVATLKGEQEVVDFESHVQEFD